MKTFRVTMLSLSVILFLFLPNGYAEDKAFVKPAESPQIGEHLKYKITWLKIPIGYGDLWVKEKVKLNGRDVIHVVGTLETNKVLRKIFPIKDEARTWMDAETFESLQFEKKIHEPFIDTHEKMVFDAKAGKGYFESLKTGHKNEFKVRPPAHDVFTAFFWARRQALQIGESAKMVLIADQKEWELTVLAKKVEKIKIDGLKIEVVRMDPTSVTEGETKKGKARFFFTNDASRTPVKIIYKAPFGKMVGILIVPKKETETGSKV